MDYSIGKGYYPGVGITVDPKADDGGKQSRSSSTGEEFSKKTKNLTKHADASSPPELAKSTSAINKFAELPVNYEYLSKKWTIDLPKGTKPAFACALAETIGGLLGEKKGDKHRIKVGEKGAHYQIRFSLENRDICKEHIEGFIKELIKGCEGLGIRDEAALARFLRKCPQLSSALGNSHFYFHGNNIPATSSGIEVAAACIEEAVKQKAFSFIVLFGKILGTLCDVGFNTAVSTMFGDAEKSISAMNLEDKKKNFYAAQKNLDAAKSVLICLAKLSHRDPAVEKKLLEFVVKNWKDFPEITDIVHPHLSDHKEICREPRRNDQL
jgi:hypothetical protein